MKHLLSGKGQGNATPPESIGKLKVLLAFPLGATHRHGRCGRDSMAFDDPGVVAFDNMPHRSYRAFD
jgi:hypothetical protein